MKKTNKKLNQSHFLEGFQPEIILSSQKDNEYQILFNEKITDILEIFVPKFLSYKKISEYSDYLKTLSSLIYFTIVGKQTLGEEYSFLYKFNGKNYKYEGQLISFDRKFFLLFFEVFLPFYLKQNLENYFNLKRSTILQSENLQNLSLFDIFIKNLPNFSGIFENVYKINLALFFIKGLFFNLSKRIVKIKYIFTKQPFNHNINYKKIGIIMLIQILIQIIEYFTHVIKDLHRRKKEIEEKGENFDKIKQESNFSNENNIKNENMSCGLCLDEISNIRFFLNILIFY